MTRVPDRLASELAYLRGAWRMLRAAGPMARDPSSTVNRLFERLVTQFPDREALTDGFVSLTYRQMGACADRYAWLARCDALGKGDVVALLMPNRPEFVCVWQGLAKRGVVTALLNTSLVGTALRQCIEVVRPRAIIVDPALWAPFATIRDALPRDIAIYAGTNCPRAIDLDARLAAMPDVPLPEAERPVLTSQDPCLYIYTSGTTGLPKAANLNHYRVQLTMLGFAAAAQSRAEDRVYDCLPMFHTVGGVCALGIALVNGGTLVIRPRFSARDFWPDIARERCTLFAYVGELCRYLLAQPPGPNERGHRVRLCFGNGLRPDIFAAFRNRFALPAIMEFYAATESNVALFNFDSTEGAVGRYPWWMRFKFPYALVRYDHDTGTVARGRDGFCVACAPDEPGEMLGQILDDPSRPSARFEGYADRAASAGKVIRDVFRKGDAWFSTGDLLKADARGYHYFLDRTGDTFRWKGENVSTTQVTEIVCCFAGVRDATVYGVTLPGREGRVGMAAIVCEALDAFDFAGFRDHLARELPDFARPVFLRFSSAIPATSTFKPKKSELAAQGFHPAGDDPVFAFDAGAGCFRRLDATEPDRLVAGGYGI